MIDHPIFVFGDVPALPLDCWAFALASPSTGDLRNLCRSQLRAVLFIVRAIAQAHGGDVFVRSAADSGTCLKATFAPGIRHAVPGE